MMNSVLQVTRAASEFIIITIVPSYTGKNITCLLTLALLLVLCTCNNTDGNKLVIFSGIASYYQARSQDFLKGGYVDV